MINIDGNKKVPISPFRITIYINLLINVFFMKNDIIEHKE